MPREQGSPTSRLGTPASTSRCATTHHLGPYRQHPGRRTPADTHGSGDACPASKARLHPGRRTPTLAAMVHSHDSSSRAQSRDPGTGSSLNRGDWVLRLRAGRRGFGGAGSVAQDDEGSVTQDDEGSEAQARRHPDPTPARIPSRSPASAAHRTPSNPPTATPRCRHSRPHPRCPRAPTERPRRNSAGTARR